MKNNIIIYLGLALLTTGLAACSTTPPDGTAMEKQVDRTLAEFEAARMGTLKEMRELHRTLTEQLEQVDARLAGAQLTTEERVEQERYKQGLEEQLVRLDEGMEAAEASTNDTWNDVQKGTQNTVKDVGDWFKRQADIIDRKTDSDKDQDGH